MKKEIVLWFGDFPDQRALACKLAEKYTVSGIVFERRKGTSVRKLGVKTILEKILEKLLFKRLDDAWLNLMAYYNNKFPNYPDVATIFVENINSQESFEFSSKQDSPLILISGTRLIKEKLLNLKLEIGIINLHTGLSPYVKGGPNCTNWCLANNTLHLIGNTIMWVDLGIDTGNLIATKTVDFTGEENLNQVHLKVMEEAHDLYMNTVHVLLQNPEAAPNIPQNEIVAGTTYYNKMWGFKEKRKALQNMKFFSKNIKKNKNDFQELQIKLVNCPKTNALPNKK